MSDRDEFPEDMPEEIKEILRQLKGMGSVAGVAAVNVRDMANMGGPSTEETGWPIAELRVVREKKDVDNIFPNLDLNPGDHVFAAVARDGGDTPMVGTIISEEDVTDELEIHDRAERLGLGYIPAMTITRGETEPVERWVHRPSLTVLTEEQFNEMLIYMEYGMPNPTPDWVVDLYDERERTIKEKAPADFATRMACPECKGLAGSQIVISERLWRIGNAYEDGDTAVSFIPNVTSPGSVNDWVNDKETVSMVYRTAYLVCRACEHVEKLDADKVKIGQHAS